MDSGRSGNQSKPCHIPSDTSNSVGTPASLSFQNRRTLLLNNKSLVPVGKLLFPAPRKEGFAYSRNNVVRSGLKPILRKLGIPDENVGLHAFRHGLATELAGSEPITVLQVQMRHADVRTTLKVYAHVIPRSQRDSMERIANRSIGTKVANGTRAIA
jgi:integrase